MSTSVEYVTSYPRLLHPADEWELPRKEGLAKVRAAAIAPVRPVERDLRSGSGSSHRRRTIAVERVEALAGAAVIGIVVVGLIGRHRLLVDQGGDPPVVAHEKHDVV